MWKDDVLEDTVEQGWVGNGGDVIDELMGWFIDFGQNKEMMAKNGGWAHQKMINQY